MKKTNRRTRTPQHGNQAGNFDVDSKFRCRKSFEKLKNISTVVEKASTFRRSTSNQRRIDVDISTVFYSASKKRWKIDVEISTSIQRRIDVDILTMPAGNIVSYGVLDPIFLLGKTTLVLTGLLWVPYLDPLAIHLAFLSTVYYGK